MDEQMKAFWMETQGLCQTTTHPCFRRLIGKHCLCGRPENECECIKYDIGSGLLDHPYGFYLPASHTGSKILECIVTHPYNVTNCVPNNQDELRLLKELCSDLGLTYEILPELESWYSQGHTHMIVIRRRQGGTDGSPDKS